MAPYRVNNSDPVSAIGVIALFLFGSGFVGKNEGLSSSRQVI